MCSTFAEVKLFQVKPDKLSEFEDLVTTMVQEQEKQQGSVCVKYMKRFFIFDKIGNPPLVYNFHWQKIRENSKKLFPLHAKLVKMSLLNNIKTRRRMQVEYIENKGRIQD